MEPVIAEPTPAPLPAAAPFTPKTRNDQEREQALVALVQERFDDAARFDQSYKDAAMRHWMNLNNVLPIDWPFYSRFFEPETSNTAWTVIEGIMSKVFEKDTYFDVEPVEEQDEEQCEMMRQLMTFVLREKMKYKLLKFYQCQEAVFFGNGVERLTVEPKLVTHRRMKPMYHDDMVPVRLGMQPETIHEIEVWPTGHIVSRFDCFPARTGATIQEMPYFIERVTVPLDKLKAEARRKGYKNVEKLDGRFGVDTMDGRARGQWGGHDWDRVSRLQALGFDVDDGPSDTGDHAVKYAELLIYSEAPPHGEGCGRILIVGDGQHLLKEIPANPYFHGQKMYADIKYRPRSPHEWQAIGEPEKLETLQEKINTRSAQIGDIIEEIRSPMTWVGDGAGVDDLTELRPWPGAIYRVKDVGAVQDRVRPGVPNELFMELDYTRAAIQRTGGAVDYSRGIAGRTTGLSRGAETATGISLLTEAANATKNFSWLLAEQTGIVDGLNMVSALIQQTMTMPQKIKIIGESKILQKAGWVDFMVVNPEDIAGRWNFFAVGASQVINSKEQAALIEGVMKGWREMPDVAPRIKQLEVAIRLADMAGVRNPSSLLMNDEEWEAAQEELAAKEQAALEQAKAETGLEVAKKIPYSDAPPDIRRQLEALAGLEPSQMEDAINFLQQQLEMAKAAPAIAKAQEMMKPNPLSFPAPSLKAA